MKPKSIERLGKKLFDLYLFGMLSVLAGDLIYLYFAGGWTDTPAIVTVELIFLSILVVAGIVKCWLIIRRLIWNLTETNGAQP